MTTLAASTYVLWDSPAARPLAIGAAVAVVVAVWWLYPPQVRSLRRPFRWMLPASRAAAMLAVAVALLQPVVVRPKTGGEQGGVLVLVDQSQSMSVTDTGRSPAALVALADGLGALPPGKRDATPAALKAELAQLAALVDEVSRARSEVDYAALAGRDAEEPRARLEQDVRQMNASAAALAQRAPALPKSAGLPERFHELTNPPTTPDEAGLKEIRARVERATRACDAYQAEADAALHAVDPAVKSVCDTLAQQSRAGLVHTAAGRIASLFPGAATHRMTFSEDIAPVADVGRAETGSSVISDVTGALAVAADRSKWQSLQAVLLLSDGRQVGGRGAGAAVSLPPGVPLFAINAADAVRRDVSVLDIEVPSGQFVGETVDVRVRLRGAGMKGASAEVRLDVDGVVTSRLVAFAEPEATVTFPLTLRVGGIRQIEVSVPGIDGEITDRNNRAARWIKVFAQRTPAAVVVGPDVWAGASLRRVLERDAGFDATFQQLASPLDRVTLPVRAIAEQEVVVLSDVGVANLSRAQRIALYRYVTDRGGSLILFAGADHVPNGFASIPMMAELLPFDPTARAAWRVWPGETPALRLVPSRQSLTHPALKLDDDPARSAALWHGLPGVFRYMPLLDLKPDAVPLLVERASGVAAATETRLGAGRVIYFGTNETWRWASGGGAAEHERFWRQLLRYAAGEPYTTSGLGLSLDVEPPSVAPGERIILRGRLRDDDGTVAQGLELAVLRDGQRVTQVSLLPGGDPQAGRFQATLPGMQGGNYELRLFHPTDSSAWISLPLRVEKSAEAELADLSADERLLRRLSEPTGGGVLALSELPTLPQRVADARDRREQVVQYPLWDSPYLFAFVVACLTMEWALRKRFGLA